MVSKVHAATQVIMFGHLIDSMYCASTNKDMPLAPNLDGLSDKELIDAAKLVDMNRKRKINSFTRDLRDTVSNIILSSPFDYYMVIIEDDFYEDPETDKD